MRYIIFSGEQWYPSGGWNDFYGWYSSLEEAQKEFKKNDDDWVQLVDINEGVIDERYRR